MRTGTAAPEAGVPVFDAAAADFRAGLDRLSEDFTVSTVPAPKRLAPHAEAAGVTVHRDGDEIASGRLVLLYDPAEPAGWSGPFRLIALVQADIEPEVAADPLLGEVGWSWLTEALQTYVPGYAAESGTVTREITEGFGGKEDEPMLTDFQLRASWTPVPEDDGELDLGGHVLAWAACIAAAAGLEPPGTRAIARRRR